MTAKPTSKLTSTQVELVLKRAADLETAHREQDDDTVEAAEVERLGQEVGLSAQAVTQALAELQRGQLVASSTPDALDRVLGDPIVSISRWVPQPPTAVDPALARFMNEQLMVLDREQGECRQWIRAQGLFAGLAGSVRFADRYSFGPASRIETTVVADDEGSLVTFRVDMGAARKIGTSALAWRGLALSGMGALMSQGVAEVFTAVAFLGMSGLGVGALWWRERHRFAQLRARVGTAPERFLDRLASPALTGGESG